MERPYAGSSASDFQAASINYTLCDFPRWQIASHINKHSVEIMEPIYRTLFDDILCTPISLRLRVPSRWAALHSCRREWIIFLYVLRKIVPCQVAIERYRAHP